jgi:iron(III) transport system permease protein
MTQRQLSTVVIVFLSFLGLVPILFMIGSTLFGQNGFSLDAYEALFSDNALWKSFQNSLLLAFTVATATTVLGTLLAILLSKTNLYFRFIWMIILIIPLLIPPYILAYGWYGLLGRESDLGHILFGFWGTFFILFSVYLPIPIFIVSLFLQHVNPRLEEAGLLYCNWRCVLTHIIIPLIFPALVFSFLLVFMLSIGEFSVANFLRYDIFPMESFIQFSAFYDFKTATVYTMPLVIIVVLVLLVQFLFSGQHTLNASYQNNKLIPIPKNRQVPLIAILLLFILTIVGFPLFGLLKHIDMQSFILAFEHALPSLRNSVVYAFLGATLLACFGFLTAYIIHYKTTKAWYFLQSFMLFLFVLSSITLGISLILFWNHSLTNFVYATPLILLLGYLIKYLFLSSKIIELKFVQIPSSLIESAQLTGASWHQILWGILLPLVKDTLIFAWFMGFIFTLRESTLSMLLSPAGSSTLPTYIFTQMANGKEATIASLCLMMILTILLPLFTFIGYTSKKMRDKGKLHDRT